jgi:hypothetical protein
MAALISLAFFDNPVWNNLALILGELLLVFIAFWLIFSILMGVLIVISIHKKHMYFPRLLRPFFTIMEGTVRVVCLILGVDGSQLMEFLIKIDNQMNLKNFARIPVEQRAVFFPQCLRARDCPARLTPDGLKCVSCGKCTLGRVVPALNEAGYKTFIIPGSTFIKRMIKKYKPKAMIGVGCMMEVKEGLEMGRKISMTTLGVVTQSDGCVETTMDFEQLMEVASLGLLDPIRMKPDPRDK